MIQPAFEILNQRGTPMFFSDVFANRPTAGIVGRIFISTDTYAFYRDTGSGWDLIGGPGSGTITGSGAVSQVAFWSGSSTITGENNLWWDFTNNHFGINTNTPGTAADIHHDQSTILQLNQTTASNDTRIAFQNSGTSLWRIGNFYNAGANDWGIYDVIGAIQPLSIAKTTGQTFIGSKTTASGRLVVNSASSDAHIQVVGASAPSIRIDNAGTGATQRLVFGLATATNNFIQGSTAGDICISTASASPLLFGMWQTINAIEVMRISTANNWILGSVVDNGQKLQITGTTKITQSLIIGNVNTSDSNLYVESGNARIFNALRINKNGSFFAASSSRGVLEIDGTTDAIFALTTNNLTRSYFYYSSSILQLVSDTNYQMAIGGATSIYCFASTQNVYLGTSNTPTDNGSKLQVAGNIWATGISQSYIAGNLGIGATTATYKCTTDGYGNEYMFAALSTNIGTIGNWVGYLYGFTGSTYQKGATIFESISANGTGKFHIALNNGANSSNVSIADAKVTILPSGEVGINTTNPTSKLQLNGTLRIDGQTSGSAGGSSGQHLIINCDGTTYKIALLNP